MKKARIDVVAFGEILWDIFETKKGIFQRELGGAPANLATTLARLGVHVAVVGGLGRDRFGDDLAAFLKAEKVDTRFLVRLPNRTGVTFVFRDARGEPTFLFYRNQTADMSVGREHVVPAMGDARFALIGTSTLVAPGLAGATRLFLRHASEHGAHVIVDLNVRAHLWSSQKVMKDAVSKVIEEASLVKASLTDLTALDLGNEAAALRWVRAKAPRATVIVTRGAGKASAYGAHGETSLSGKKARCVDATGAGDAFLAGVIAALVAAGAEPGGAAWEDRATWLAALEIGHSLGVKAVSKIGAVSGITQLAPLRSKLKMLRISKRI
ncbi:MAG: carbohydrate kinase [Polyangiaceae bacterium]